MPRFITALLLASSLLAATAASANPVRELIWDDLIPPDAPPVAAQMAPMHDLSQLANVLNESGPAASQPALNAPVVKALDGENIRLPGYIVPLDTDDNGDVTSFLLVPYFGACIHVPPPPPNQIVMVRSQKPVKMESLYQPFWIEGKVKVESASSEIADAGYQLQASKIYPYELPDS
ncbi:DUF3299 domain-containing protein [Pseudomonas sp.]|uniref:DUF3299 domain-containing protein n=1 Tax=Pseudomonas sp. TaxID=306 RepID=UPI00257DEC90|nr:DUF3299 domain-containing protein [Pseudomonas sp.]